MQALLINDELHSHNLFLSFLIRAVRRVAARVHDGACVAAA